MTGAMMGYPQTSSSIVGNTNGGLLYDSRFGGLYGVNISGGATAGLRKWDSYPNGLELRARNVADLGNVGLYFQNTITYNSAELVINTGTSNSAALNGYSSFDLTQTSMFGANSSDLSPSGQLRILSPKQLCAFRYNEQDFVVTVSLTPNPAEINCVNWGYKLNAPTTIAEASAVIGAVPDGSGSTAWVLGYNSNSTNLSLYKVLAPGSLEKIGSFGPKNIDPTWTNANNVFGIAVDQTDGNLIAAFSTFDTATNTAYIAKINAANAAIMWVVPVGNGIAYNASDIPKQIIKNGTLYYLGVAFNSFYTINTLTGAYTEATVSNIANSGYQISEDVSGSIFWYGNWSEGNTHPNYLGNYCLTQGFHSGGSMCWRYWPTYPIANPPVYAAPASSRKRAWSFVLDGHTFYVLDLGQQGTWIYDSTTDQWCQFITQGYQQWNFANGVMWGQRIVAGDLLTTEVWELQPDALFDNGATDIVHVVTGGVSTRSRVYHSVDAFRLACSSGYVQDAANANVTLSFSDDQGNTWTQMDTKTLTPGNYSGEVAWRALGAFSAPGRIFKIMDVGGFLRIDGADAGIDGFDPATADPGL